jgi:DNA-binding LytR/AlgR family response regulator
MPFLRVHRSHILNLDHAAALERSVTGLWQLRLKNGGLLAVGRPALAKLRQRLV